MFLMVDKLTFGQWLQFEREKREWTQSDLARKSDKDRAVINKIESGGAMPAVETYLALADALELSPIVLFRAAGLLPPSTEEKVTLEDWQYLLSQLPSRDQEEMRQIAVMKIERNRQTEAQARTAQFAPKRKKGN